MGFLFLFIPCQLIHLDYLLPTPLHEVGRRKKESNLEQQTKKKTNEEYPKSNDAKCVIIFIKN